MKKALLFFLMITTQGVLLCSAQSDKNLFAEESISAVRKGSFTGDAFYGFPNFYTLLSDNLIFTYGPQAISTKKIGFGPIGGRVEYLLSHKFGFGLEVAYLYSRVEQTFKSEDNDSVIYRRSLIRSKLGFVPTFNYHFSKNSLFDFYVTGGVGIKYSKTVLEGVSDNYHLTFIIPIAWRLAFGARFFPTPHLGFGMNMGIGQGGIINFSASYKF
ncbi:MAG: hypothetical protein KJ941_11090 [Bacteroidetes bacterium]|nr:hypothetical protein [Bacteroidota bacterium]